MSDYEQKVTTFVKNIKVGETIILSDFVSVENMDKFRKIASFEILKDWTLGINTDFTEIKRSRDVVPTCILHATCTTRQAH